MDKHKHRKHTEGNGRRSHDVHTTMATTLWNIWVHRNKVVFEGESSDPSAIISLATKATHDTFRAFLSRNPQRRRRGEQQELDQLQVTTFSSDGVEGTLCQHSITLTLIRTKDKLVSQVLGGKLNKVNWETKPILDDLLVLKKLFHYIGVCNENHDALKWTSKEALRSLGNP
ncbi:hypothetical protein Goarm_001289 [Gossypium armourianum]|uniref:Uncharacterized protein n=1 Tax=Gossypium armourianum TaxID=34283 RepID=A0A7J9KD36_9ROSI|nr:hypothetical protein [Gossypium armourianum]